MTEFSSIELKACRCGGMDRRCRKCSGLGYQVLSIADRDAKKIKTKKKETMSMENQATESLPRVWSDVENAAILHPKMQEITDGQAFIEEMVRQTGVRRSFGGYKQKLMLLREKGHDVNQTLFRSISKLESRQSQSLRQARIDGKANGYSKANGHTKVSGPTKKDVNPPNAEQNDPRRWVVSDTFSWLMNFSHARTHQLSKDNIVRHKTSPNGSFFVYSLDDALAHLRSASPKRNTYATIAEAREILGHKEASYTKTALRPFLVNGSSLRRADLIEMWMESRVAPLMRPTAAEKHPRSDAVRQATEASAKKAKAPVKKPTVTAKPVKPPSPAASPQEVWATAHTASHATATPKAATSKTAADVEWMIDGVRRGLIDKNQVAEMVTHLAKQK